MRIVKKIDIAEKGETEKKISQRRRRNRRADTKIFYPGESGTNPYPAFSIKRCPDNGWVLAYIDKDGKITSIAKNIPTRSLAETVLRRFKDGKYQADKMNGIKNPHELPTLIILCDWLRSLQKLTSELREYIRIAMEGRTQKR